MNSERVILPDGSEFRFWDDKTAYGKVYHVACKHPGASDDNPGTAEKPFASIGRAAGCLQPGEKVLVHEGIYRECVSPSRGGTGPDRMIAYEGVPGETVVIRASDPWHPDCAKLSDVTVNPASACDSEWFAELPMERFVGYNPFQAPMMRYLPWYEWSKRPAEEIERALLPRGRILQDGRPLALVPNPHALQKKDGTFCITGDGTAVVMRLFGDVAPADAHLELTIRWQCFAPRARGLGFIRVSGFVMEHAANGVPMPQRGALSTSAGHHWIVERNTIRLATANGLDIGWQSDVRSKRVPEETGGHIVRGNTVTDCGISGLSGTQGVHNCLVEDNVFERIGGLNLERCYEAAAIKVHFARNSLIRRNVIRHIRDAAGIWLDYCCGNNRVSRNVIADVETILCGIYIEANREPHLVDGNVLWDIRNVPGNVTEENRVPGGCAIASDVSDHTVVAHNFAGMLADGYAVALHLGQKARLIGPSSVLLTGMKAMNNVVVRSRLRVFLEHLNGNTADGNLYDAAGDAASLCVNEPTRMPRYSLAAWRKYFGLDTHGAQCAVEADFDPDTRVLSLRFPVRPEVAAQPVPELYGAGGYAGPGPFDAATWRLLSAGERVTVSLPVR